MEDGELTDDELAGYESVSDELQAVFAVKYKLQVLFDYKKMRIKITPLVSLD